MIICKRVQEPSAAFEAAYVNKAQEELLYRRANYDELVQSSSKLCEVYWNDEPVFIVGALYDSLCSPEGCFVWLMPCEAFYHLPVSAYKQLLAVFDEQCPRNATATCHTEADKRFARLFGFKMRQTVSGLDIMVRK